VVKISEIYKIVFVGLDFAGKTSILKVLAGSYSDLDRIKPTLGRERTEWDILGFKVINWDLGGQKQYRDEYIANAEQVLRDTNLLIFVVDVQDAERINDAANYFNDILHALDLLKIKCPVILCLHKVDPDIAKNPPIVKNLDWVTNLFSEFSEKHDVETNVFITSIFDRKSLIEMFSHGIGTLIPISILNTILDNFIKETKDIGVVGTILFDMNYIVVGSAFTTLNTRHTCFRTINAFTTLMRDFKGVYDEDRQISFNISISNGDIYRFTFSKFSELTSPFYLLIMGKQSLKVESAFTLFRKKYLPKIDESLHELIKKIE